MDTMYEYILKTNTFIGILKQLEEHGHREHPRPKDVNILEVRTCDQMPWAGANAYLLETHLKIGGGGLLSKTNVCHVCSRSEIGKYESFRYLAADK